MPGIDDIAFHVPQIYLPIDILAKERNIEYAKLNKRLGLEAMSLVDVHEDASTMAANAVKTLIEKNRLNPHDIGRIYVGSESAADGSKAKVFSGQIQKKWRERVSKFGLFETLASRNAISFETYERLHGRHLTQSVVAPNGEFYLDEVSNAPPLFGKKTYKFGTEVHTT